MEKLLHVVGFKSTSYEGNTFRFQKKLKNFTFLIATFTMLFFSLSASASHFRYGNISWTRVSETPTTVTIQLNVSTSWRLGAAPGSIYFTFSGGPTSGGVSVPVTVTTDPSGGWSNAVGSATTTLQKSTTPYLIAFNGGNKIGGLQNNNGGYWNVYTIVNTNAPGSSPVSTLPAIINMPVGVSATTYTIPASDPDANSSLSYRFATPTEMAGAYVSYATVTQPAGLSINTSTGQLTFNTIGKATGQLYNAGVVVTDNDGNQIFLDFLINITNFSTPPVFDYSVTPANGTTFNVISGQNISFSLKATDSDPGSSVSLSASGLPNYITTSNFSPAFPATGNPSQTTFNYTPSAAQIGSTVVLNFIATDNVGVQSSTSVTVRVVAEPVPTFSAQTLTQNSLTQIQTGVPFTTTIEAVSSLGSNVSIAFANGVPSGASLSPTVPTVGANPGITHINWTPTPADFGQKNLSFIAQIANIPTIYSTRNFSLIVNTPPVFTSTNTVNEVVFGNPFSYNITISDLDIPYGDVVNVESLSLPSWLTLTSTGNGTATLSGTPSITDGGIYHIKLEAADTYHHGNPSPVIQEFDLKVTVCNTTLSSTSVGTTCPTSADGSIDLSVSGGKAPLTYVWSNGATSEDISGLAAGNYSVTVTDANSCSATSTITIVAGIDSIAPVAPVLADVLGQCSATVSSAPNAVDNCAGIIVGTTSDALSYSTQGTHVITWSFNDGNGNVSTTTQNVIIKDVTAPVSPVLADVLGQCSATVSSAPTAVDNCAGIIVGTTSDALSYSTQGTHVITWSFDDGNGNVSTASQNVIVKDDTNPIVLTQNLTINLSASGSANITVADINNGSSDNCAIASIVLDKTSFSCANVGDNIVKLTVTDASGNVAFATATVTVKDVTPPTITVPISFVVNTDLNKCSAVVNYVTPTATDNCSVVTSANVVHVLNRGQQFYDFSNNRFESQNSPGLPLTFTPTDGQKMAVFLQSSGSTHYLYQNVSLPVSGPILLTYDLKYTNHFGSFSSNQFISVQIRNASTNALLRTVFTTSSGSPAITPMTSYSFDISEFAGQNVRLQMIDATINNFYMDVLLDNVKITGSSLVNGSFESDYTGWVAFSANSSSGTWGIGYGPGTTIVQTAGLPSGSVFPVGLTLNSFRATDASGNNTDSSFNVTVEDKQLPTVIVQNKSIQLDGSGNATITAADINNGSTDNCGIATVVLSKTSFDCSNFGANTVTLTVTDIHGNVSSKDAVVTVKDNVAPIVIVQNKTIQLNASGNASITTADINNGSTDNCGIASVVLSKTSFDCSNFGANTVTLTVTDIHGNVSTKDATVTVEDNVAPIVLTQNKTIQLNASGSASITAADINNGSTDNCGIASVVLSKTSFDCSNYGANTVTLTVTDIHGNVSTADAIVTVQDNVAPIVVAQNKTIQLNASGNATITAADINNGSSDNCGITSVVLSKTSFDCSNFGTNTVTLTVTDIHGNISTADAIVTVQDNVAPIVLTQNKTIQLNASGNATITAADINNGSTDNCGIASVVLSKTSFDCSNYGANTVNLTVTDIHGNVATATAIVTVQDNVAPIVITQNLVIPLSGGSATISAAQINNGSTDNCGIASMTINRTGFDCSSIGNNTITLTVTDIHGNVSTKTASVTIVGELTSTNIASAPTNSTYTGGVSTNLYLGYGAQSTTLQTSNIVVGGNGTSPKSYTYAWSGSAVSQLSSTTSGSPVFTPTTAGYYTFNVLVTNKYGCTSAATISICVKDIREVTTDKKGITSYSGKVFICHAPPGNVGNSNTLSISVNAVAAHLSQHSFDRLGSCADAPCSASQNTMSTNSTSGAITAPVKIESTEISLHNTEFVAYPNPFGKQTTVRFTLPYQEDKATLDIYDLKGVRIQNLFNGNANAQTTYEVQFNGQNIASGTYIFRLITSKEVKNFKVIMTQ